MFKTKSLNQFNDETHIPAFAKAFFIFFLVCSFDNFEKGEQITANKLYQYKL